MLAPFEAPEFLKDAATGITAQEQSGRGIPKTVDFITEPKLLFPKCFFIMESGKKTYKTPAISKPKSKNIATSLNKKKISFNRLKIITSPIF
jgi:hypothetical protein